MPFQDQNRKPLSKKTYIKILIYSVTIILFQPTLQLRSENDSLPNIIDSYPEDFNDSGDPNPFFKKKDLSHHFKIQHKQKNNQNKILENKRVSKENSLGISEKIENLKEKLEQMLRLEKEKNMLDKGEKEKREEKRKVMKAFAENESVAKQHKADTQLMIKEAKRLHRKMFLAAQKSQRMVNNSKISTLIKTKIIL